MKYFIPILISTLAIVSCSIETKESAEVNNHFDTLPLHEDSTVLYFKTKPNWQDTTRDALDSFVNSWYSHMLFALKEPILKDYDGAKEVYRFTWLRSFNHPVVIRLEKQGDSVRLISKVSDGAAGYEPGKIFFDTILNITQKQVDVINHHLNSAKFWTLQTETRDNDGKDGSEWIIEVYKDNQYHMAVRWTPMKGTAFRRIGEYMLSISQINNETGKHDDY